MAKKIVAVSCMDEIPSCLDCPFRILSDDNTTYYCMAQSYHEPKMGWHFHYLKERDVLMGLENSQWRERSCPLVLVEHKEDAYWAEESERVVLCSSCDGAFLESTLHDITDDSTYPRYCPMCGAKMIIKGGMCI